jgi:cysteinyl-tRNA synthetase
MQAFHDCRQWVNYFLHTGHLHGLQEEGEAHLASREFLECIVDGDEVLETFRHLEANARLDFKESVMQEVRSAESLLNVRLHYTTDTASIASGEP